MKPKFIISFLYYFIWIALVVLTLATVLFLVTSIINMHDKSKSGFVSEFMESGFPVSIYHDVATKVDYSYASDSTFRYIPVIKEYNVQVKSNTSLAYYFFIFKIILLSLNLIAPWFILKILKTIKQGNPFNFQSVKYLKIIAVIFITADILIFINNLIFNQFINQSELQHGFQFPNSYSIGSGVFIGLVIWILAVIFERGVELQNENDLTV